MISIIRNVIYTRETHLKHKYKSMAIYKLIQLKTQTILYSPFDKRLNIAQKTNNHLSLSRRPHRRSQFASDLSAFRPHISSSTVFTSGRKLPYSGWTTTPVIRPLSAGSTCSRAANCAHPALYIYCIYTRRKSYRGDRCV